MYSLAKETNKTMTAKEIIASLNKGVGVFVVVCGTSAGVLSFDEYGWHIKRANNDISWKTDGPIENIFNRFLEYISQQNYQFLFFETQAEFEKAVSDNYWTRYALC